MNDTNSKNATKRAGNPIILDGRKVRDAEIPRLKEAIKRKGIIPTLAIIQVGSLEESTAYINRKKNFASKIGARVIHKQLPADVDEEVLVGAVENFNRDSAVHGIIVQLPIPARLPKQKIIDRIDLKKDVDGLTSANRELFEGGSEKAVVPATARGVLTLLRNYGVSVSGKKATVIGRSALVGGPVAVLLKREGAEVAVCHRGTEDIPAKSRQADILVVAIGQPKFVGKDYVSSGQTVVDVGINSIAGEKLEEEIPQKQIVGDVDFEAVKGIVGAITPSPGGVGPMTVLSLFENLCDAAGVAK
jgi:5,10-methylene-tetrahydrofolate dehydrogenase/methenyl tetrahydrofolate cyclohydrolase